MTVVLPTATLTPDSSHTLQLRLPGQWPTDGDDDDEPGVGVDDHLMVVGGVPVILGLLDDGVATPGDRGAVHDQHSALAEPLARPQVSERPEMVDHSIHCRFRPLTAGRVDAG